MVSARDGQSLRLGGRRESKSTVSVSSGRFAFFLLAQLWLTIEHSEIEEVKNPGYIYVYLAGFSKRLSTVTGPVSPVPPPPPNFPVPSSYEIGSCLNIRTSLDILDNIHPRK